MATKAWSPAEVEVEMRDTIEKLDDAVIGQRDLGREAALASHAYRQAQAQAWMKAKVDPGLKTDSLRKAWVDGETSEEMLARDLSEAAYEASKSLVRSLQTRADILRSLARSSRDLVDSWHGGS